MDDGLRTYQASNLGNDAIVQQGENLSLTINRIVAPLSPTFSYRGIAGVPPPTEQNLIQQRTQLVETMDAKLRQPGINALTLTGIGGVGKSTLAALLYRRIQTEPITHSTFFRAAPLWLSIDKATTFADIIGTLFERLEQPVSVLSSLSVTGQIEALFTLLDTIDSPRLIVLDQFENLLDWTTGKALSTQLGVSEFIDALNSHPWRSNCRLLLTSRPSPKGTREAPSVCLQECPVESLTSQEGVALLRSQGIQASETTLQQAVAFCKGHALSLVLLITLLQLYGTSLSEVLTEPALWIGDIASNLLDAVFQFLTEEQRQLLRALSIYRVPVSLVAIVPFVPKTDSQQALQSLRSLLIQHLIQAVGNGYYLVHAVVARYAQEHFVEGDRQANQQAVSAAHAVAAQYYIEQAQVTAPSRQQRRWVNDVQLLIEAIWHYTQAAQWQKAYELIEQEYLFPDLSTWGGYTLLVDLCRWFLPPSSWQPQPEQLITIYLYLGVSYSVLGKKQEALDYYQQALLITREVGDRGGEGSTQWNIGALAFHQGYYDFALAAFCIAKQCFQEVSSPLWNQVDVWIDALRQKIGEKRFKVLQAHIEPRAKQIVEQALRDQKGQNEKEK